MAQVKVYGLAESLNPIKLKLSETIHSCIVEALHFPSEKKVHRFFPMAKEDFIVTLPTATEKYPILEISLMEGRSVETKKLLIRLLFTRICEELCYLPGDIEITITESPKSNWGFRGLPGDEIGLNYKIEV